jgi:hypothetical protein
MLNSTITEYDAHIAGRIKDGANIHLIKDNREMTVELTGVNEWLVQTTEPRSSWFTWEQALRAELHRYVASGWVPTTYR